MRRLALAITTAALLGCGRGRVREAETPLPPERPSFTIHEWGLFGIDASARDRAWLGASAAHRAPFAAPAVVPIQQIERSNLARPAKPVLYVHLGERTSRVQFDLSLGIPSASLIERWPAGGMLAAAAQPTRAGWTHVIAERGACARPSPLPSATSQECAHVADGFCEAAELERYAGDRDTCLHVGSASSELLFYRASGVPVSGLPLELMPIGSDFMVRAQGGVEGPVLYFEAESPNVVPEIRAVPMNHFNQPLGSWEGPALEPSLVRAMLIEEAIRRGLTEIEADAFVDAWAAAIFEPQRRTGEGAAGTPPPALALAGRFLLYFAPRAAVDAMLPLSTEPPASAYERVFLVRIVDPQSVFPPRDPAELGTLGHGGGGGSAPAPCTHDCPHVDREITDISSGYTRDVVERVLRRTRGMVAYCYEQGLATDRTLAGTIDLWLAIRETGLVAASRVRGGTLTSPRVRACLESASRRWVFPEHTSRSAVSIRETLTFSVGEPTEH